MSEEETILMQSDMYFTRRKESVSIIFPITNIEYCFLEETAWDVHALSLVEFILISNEHTSYTYSYCGES